MQPALDPGLTQAPPAEPRPVGQGAVEAPSEAGAILAALMATGASLEEGVVALREAGLPAGAMVAAILDAKPLADGPVMALVAKALWAADAPGDAAPVLRAREIHPIRVLGAPLDNPIMMTGLAAILTEDMSLVRAINGNQPVVFRHPAGALFNAPYRLDGCVNLHGNPDGSVWTPRDVTAEGLVMLDSHGRVARLDRFLDVIRILGRPGFDGGATFAGCGALECLPDVVEICAKGELDLSGCVSLARLPARLKVGAGGTVNLTGCAAWDGTLPPQAKFGRGATLTLPDGALVLADAYRRSSRGQDTPLPKDRGALLAMAKSMGKILGDRLDDPEMGFFAALATLTERGADLGLVTDLLVARIHDRRNPSRWGLLDNLQKLLEAFPSVVPEIIDRVDWWMPDQGPLTICASETWANDRMVFGGDGSTTFRSRLVAFPANLRATGLCLDGMERLERLPEGMDLRPGTMLDAFNKTKGSGFLMLTHCPALKTLPANLCCEELEVTGCRSWDRIVPAGVRVSGRIVTDGHRYPGLTLEEWRERYGMGPGA